jgi:hypothetical protein
MIMLAPAMRFHPVRRGRGVIIIDHVSQQQQQQQATALAA